jgi:hypothetical protein
MSLAQRASKAKLAHRSVLDEQRKRTTDEPCQGKNGTCPKKTKERSLGSTQLQQGTHVPK